MKESIYQNEQELLKALSEIHLKGQKIELDPMFFKGNFYKNGVEKPNYCYDINPQVLFCKKADARNLPLKDNSIKSMILDPPFMFGIHGKTEKYYSSRTHGIFKNFEELKELYRDLLIEAKRVLKKKGIVIFKCQDYTDNKTTMTHCWVWKWAMDTGFYVKDLAVLHLLKGKVYNSKLKQRHLRKTHSYFWILENK